MLRRQFDQVSFIITHECWREIRMSGEIIKGCGRNRTFSPVRTPQFLRKIFCQLSVQKQTAEPRLASDKC